jgi:FlaG/FlaF family flagellin (archaellin)
MIGLVVIMAAGVGAFVLDFNSQMGKTAPKANFAVEDAESGTTDTIHVSHEGGTELNAQDTMIKVKRDGATLATFSNGNDVDISVGDTISIESDDTSTTVSFAGSAAYSSSSNTFDLESDPVKVLIIDDESDQQIAELTASA